MDVSFTQLKVCPESLSSRTASFTLPNRIMSPFLIQYELTADEFSPPNQSECQSTLVSSSFSEYDFRNSDL